MNYTVIVLGVLLVVVIYMLYNVVSNRGKMVSSKVDLSATGNGTVTYKTLANPTSSRYTFSCWVYMDVLVNNSKSEIIHIGTGTSPTSPSDFFTLYVDETAKLYYKIKTTDNNDSTNLVMTNFPLQKWVHVMISFDGKIVDLYYDGKLIRSHQLPLEPKKTTSNFTISYGNCSSLGCKGFLANFERIPNAIDPSTAWSKYMDGNGGNYFSKLLSSYGASLTLTRDTLDLSKFTLF